MVPNAAFLTGPSDLMVFLAGLDQRGGDIGDWHVVLMGRPSNIPAAMLDTCRTMAPGARVPLPVLRS